MSNPDDTHQDDKNERRARLGKISEGQKADGQPAQVNRSYSRFIRWMRLVLPLVALIITAVVFTWSNMSDENIVPVQEQAAATKTIGKNELLNPRFESSDENKQPYTITAKRAIQGEANEDLIILDEPLADMLLSGGNWVALEARQGAFRQDNQRLLLKGEVRLFHDRGYKMETAQLQLDLEKNTAWSDEYVYGQGPAGTLEASGLKANTNTGELVFHGPARLILNRSVSNGNFGELR